MQHAACQLQSPASSRQETCPQSFSTVPRGRSHFSGPSQCIGHKCAIAWNVYREHACNGMTMMSRRHVHSGHQTCPILHFKLIQLIGM
eukprot:scaffold33436_cov25-Tisochrysis_lutea.AAC.1